MGAGLGSIAKTKCCTTHHTAFITLMTVLYQGKKSNEVEENYYLSKDRCLFPRVTKRVDLPSNTWPSAVTKVLTQELKTQCVLVNDGTIVCCCLIIHTPASQNELQTTCRTTQCFELMHNLNVLLFIFQMNSFVYTRYEQMT